MPAPPRHPDQGESSRPATRFALFVGPEDGSAPNIPQDGNQENSDFVPYLRQLVVRQTSGGSESDHLYFTYDLDEAERRIENLETLLGYNRQVECRILNRRGQLSQLAGGWGDLTVQNLDVGREEGASFYARLEPYHFGGPLEYLLEWSEQTKDFEQVDRDLVYNPLIDDKIQGNQSSQRHEFATDIRAFVWVDHRSVETTTAQQYNNVEAEKWLLPEAVDSLCWLLNPEEEFVKNPDLDALVEVFEEAPELDNIRIKRGNHLSACLDQLLQPLGYDWYVSYEIEQGELQRQIQVYERGKGPEKEVWLQPRGEQFENTRTNLQDARIELNLADLANEIVGYGSYIEKQHTFELFKAWEEEHDSIAVRLLDKQPDNTSQDKFEDHPDVWRKWVVNEGGDYTLLRSDLEPTYIEGQVPKRRQVLNCLFHDSHGKRHRPVVEYRTDSTDGWLEVPEEYYPDMLKDELGIYFNQRIPWSLQTQDETFRLRLTCAVQYDQRLLVSVNRTANSPNKRKVILFLDLENKFHYRQPDFETDHYTQRWIGPGEMVDDTDKLQEYLENLQGKYENATMRTELELIGLHFDYQIGDLITKINGRNITLNRSGAGGTPKYLQLTGQEWNEAQQSTRLIVEAVEDR